MLFAKPVAKGDIVSVRLMNGEEIIGRYSDGTTSSVKLDKPVVLITQMVSPTQAQVGFAPFMTSIDDNHPITVAFTSISAGPIATKPDIAASYRNATSSLAVPTSGGGLIV